MTTAHEAAHSARSCRLDLLMADLDPLSDLGEGGGPPLTLPLVAGVGEPSPGEHQVHLAPPGADVYDTLVGLVAPRSWHSLIVHVEGSAISGESARRTPVRLKLGVCRCGRATSRLEPVDADDEIPATAGEAGRGLLLDCARRVFGLPTPPPPTSTAELQSAMWLDALTCATLALPSHDISWTTAAALHPASADVLDDDPHDLARAAAALARACEWSSVRRAVERGERPDLPVSPGTASWMDDGLFARWCLSCLPHIDDALADLADALSPPVVDAVCAVVRCSA